MLKEVKIELTEQCKRECIHCSSKAKMEHPIIMPYDVVRRVIEESKALGARSIVFTGGEATLYPSLEKVVGFAKEQGLQTKLYTMVDPTEEGIRTIQKLTFYGLDEMIYSTTYRLTRDGVVSLPALKKFFPKLLDETPIHLGVHHAVTKETKDDIEDALQLFFSLPENRIKHFSLLRYVPHGRGDTTLMLTKEETLELRKNILRWKEQYGDKFRLGSPWNYLGITHTPCTAGDDTMIVGFDGNVYPCDAMKYFDYLGIGGNIYQKSLAEIYDSSYFQSIRAHKDQLGENCQHCKQFVNCHGGCLGQKMVHYVETGDLTFQQYGLLALRTMKNFSTSSEQKMNGEMGIIGELGEFIDSFKKYKTHGVEESVKEKLRKNLMIEAGDILWYIPASLGNFYDMSFEEIGNYIFHQERGYRRKITANAIAECALSKDPECLLSDDRKDLFIKSLDSLPLDGYSFDTAWKRLVSLACQIIYAKEKSEVLELSSEMVVILSAIVRMELSSSMEEVASLNIEKLKKRYESGFDEAIASSRVTLLSDYKQEEPVREYPYQKHI